MAQSSSRGRGLARRLGLRGREAAVAGCVVVTLVLAIAGTAGVVFMRDGFEIVRASDQRGLPSVDSGQADAEGSQEAQDGREQAPQEVAVYVHVDGAVENPGVYVIRGTTPRVGQAVQRAGGLAEDADTTTINLAAPLVDGQKVYIPHEGEEVVAEPAASAQQVTPDADLVNINTATAKELQELPGVGEVTAAAIVEERERGGPFLSPEDIMRVSGIGEKKYERMRDRIGV